MKRRVRSFKAFRASMAGMAFSSGGWSGEWTSPPVAGRVQAGAVLYRSRPGRCGRSDRPRPAGRRPGAGVSLPVVAGREAVSGLPDTLSGV